MVTFSNIDFLKVLINNGTIIWPKNYTLIHPSDTWHMPHDTWHMTHDTCFVQEYWQATEASSLISQRHWNSQVKKHKRPSLTPQYKSIFWVYLHSTVNILCSHLQMESKGLLCLFCRKWPIVSFLINSFQQVQNKN